MRHPTYILKIWDKDLRKFIDHKCYFESIVDGMEAIKRCEDNKELGFFDVDKNIYSFEQENVGFSIKKISITEQLKTLFIEMKTRLRTSRGESVQTSGRNLEGERKETTLF
jgi:hypothetical protein